MAIDCRRRRIWTGIVVLLTMVLSACGAGPANDAEVLTLGILAPLSGEYEPLGRRVRDAAILAVESRNQQGGVLGLSVQVVLEDTACDYFGGREAAQAAIDEGAQFLIGAVCANASEGVAQVASEAGVLQLSPASVDLDLTLDAEGEVRDLVFRLPVPDVTQGEIAAQFALDRLGLERAGILYAEGSEYGAALAQGFQSAFEAGGGEVVARQTYDQNAELFFESLEAMREESPEVLYVPGYHTVINSLISQARQFGLLQTVIGSDGWHSPGLNLAVADGSYFTTHYFVAEPRLLIQNWVELYEARYLTQPDALATMSFDAANLLFDSIASAGTLEPVLVAETMATSTFEGLSGSVVFDEAHNPIRSLVVLRVDATGFVFQGRFGGEPAESPDD